jgi:hypothetical protein
MLSLILCPKFRRQGRFTPQSLPEDVKIVASLRFMSILTAFDLDTEYLFKVADSERNPGSSYV